MLVLKDIVEHCFAAALHSFVGVAALNVTSCSWPAVYSPFLRHAF